MRRLGWLLITALAACGGATTTSPSPATEGAAEATDASPPPTTPPPTAARLSAGGARLQLAGDGARGIQDAHRIKVRYRAWDARGARVDGGGEAGQVASWLPRALPEGLSEAVGDMGVGQTWRVWLEGSSLEGSRLEGASLAPGAAVYDIEVLEALTLSVPRAPSDVAGAPASAEVTASGLASRVVEPGTGARHPTAASTVTVHYTGWTTDGAMFDSSVTRGREATFPLNRVIPGWTEGVQLMVPGEIRRLWIPADLAYGQNPRPGAPAGDLVFDVELLAIEDGA